MGKEARRRIDGILMLDKPAGIGSNAVLQHVKRLYRAERAGHTGTLDPMASGLLIICFGEATKFAAELLDAPKSYRARLFLGVKTTTADAEGEVLESRPVSVADEEIRRVLERFKGDILQTPPMYSALKRDGRPLYAYARLGKTVDREARTVSIYSLEWLKREGDEVDIAVNCSKGTYVRTLGEDIGEALGCGAHLSALIRTAMGGFFLDQAVTMESLAAMDLEARDRLLLPSDAMLRTYPEVELDAKAAARFRHGERVPASQAHSGLVRVYGAGRDFLGTAWSDASGALQPRRVLLQPGDSAN